MKKYLFLFALLIIKNLLLFTLLFIVIQSSCAQSLEQKVINSSGNHFSNTNQVTVSMGEAVIGHIKTPDYHVSVGFVQPFSLEVELVNGLEGDLLAQVEIYPNPTNSYINLKIPSLDVVASKIYGVVYNQTGIVVREFTLYSRGRIQQVDFSELPSGVYMLKLSNETKNNVYRIIKK